MNTQEIKQVCELKIQYKRYVDLETQKKANDPKAMFELTKLIDELQENIEYKEYFYVFCFNNASKVTGFAKIGEGGITSSTVDIRLILQHALLTNATAITLIHNHPSGNLKPSETDKMLTYQIQQAAKVCCINVIDHVIVSKNNWFSFYENHLL